MTKYHVDVGKKKYFDSWFENFGESENGESRTPSIRVARIYADKDKASG